MWRLDVSVEVVLDDSAVVGCVERTHRPCVVHGEVLSLNFVSA